MVNLSSFLRRASRRHSWSSITSSDSSPDPTGPLNTIQLIYTRFFDRTMDDATSISSQSVNIITDVNVDHLSYEASISVILLCCKKRILFPYLRLISILGWRPLFFSAVEPHICLRALNVIYTILITSIIIAGHFLEYIACHSEVTRGHEVPRLLHLLPSLFHVSAYLMVLYYSRTPESERLETLMERVFLQSSRNAGWFMCHKKLVKKLRNFFWLCMIWVIMAFVMRMLHYFWYETLYQHALMCNYKGPLESGDNTIFTTLRIACSSWNDLVCAAIVTTYSVHCQLNISYIRNLCSIIRERRISIQEFFKRVEESKNFIEYLNNDQSIGVSLLLMNLICRASLSLMALLNPPISTSATFRSYIVLIMAFSLWFSLIIIHVRQALRLTNVCKTLKNIGHELRSMHVPLGGPDNEKSDLDSLVLYTSSLSLEARIMQIPVRPSYVALIMISVTFSLLVMGHLGLITF